MCRCKNCDRSLDKVAELRIMDLHGNIIDVEYGDKLTPAYIKINNNNNVEFNVDSEQLNQIIKKLKEIKNFHDKHDN